MLHYPSLVRLDSRYIFGGIGYLGYLSTFVIAKIIFSDNAGQQNSSFLFVNQGVKNLFQTKDTGRKIATLKCTKD